MAQLSSIPLFVLLSCCSRYVVSVELIHLNDLLGNVTFLLSTNQRPRKGDKINRYINRHFDIMISSALRAAAVKTIITSAFKILAISTVVLFDIVPWSILL